MAEYFVATNGNDGNAGTSAAPWKTIRYALSGNNNKTKAGDIVTVKPGTYTQASSNDQIKPKAGVRLRAQYFACNPDGTLQTHGNNSIIRSNAGSWDLILGQGNGFTLEGFEICDASKGGAGVSVSESKNVTTRQNYIHDCSRPGIIHRECDLLLVEGNHVARTASQDGTGNGAANGITILRAVDIAGATPADWNGYRTIVRFNRSHHNIPTTGSLSDGEGIIWDGAAKDVRNYTGPALIFGNICWKNGGPGIRVMEGKDIHVIHNTCWSNMQDKRKTTDWGCGLHETLSIDNKWDHNVVLEDSNDNDTHAYKNTNAHSLFGNSTASTFFKNVLKGPGSKTIKRHVNNSLPNALNGALPGESNNKLGVNPLLVDPANENFALQAGSPAIGYGQGGEWPNAGAIQPSGPTPPSPFTITAAPTLTPSGELKPGAAFTYANGSYSGGSGTLSRTFKGQMRVGSGEWTDTGALTGGSGTFPASDAAYDFAVIELATKGTDGPIENASLSVRITPTVVEPPTTSLEDRMDAAEANINNLLARMNNVEANGGNSELASQAYTLASQANEAVITLNDVVSALDQVVLKMPEGATIRLSQFYTITKDAA